MKMYKLIGVPAALTVMVFGFGVSLPVTDAEAKVGCCLKRDSAGGRWRLTNLGFTDCERENRAVDKNSDDVYEERGLIWWNVNC